MNRFRSGLWKHPDFMRLWVGQTISEFGSRITRDGLPLIAVITLAASPDQVGLLTAAASLPILFLSLPAGVWVDRLPRRPILIVGDLGRALTLLVIPITALTGKLSFGLLLGVAVINSILTLFFNLAYHAALPWLVEHNHILEANSKLSTTESIAEIVGPSLAGMLIQVMTAPFAILFDSLSFLLSAISLLLIRKADPAHELPAESVTLRQDILEGFRVIAAHPILRIMAIGMGVRALFGNMIGTLIGLYVIRELGLTPAVFGFLISMGGIGALIGALLAERLPRQFGLGRTLSMALLISGLVSPLTPLAYGPLWLVIGLMIIPQLVGDGAMVLYQINETSLRQMLVPHRLLGRTSASIGFLAQVMTPVGALLGGVLGSAIGVRAALLVATLGILSTVVAMAISPLRNLGAEPATSVTPLEV